MLEEYLEEALSQVKAQDSKVTERLAAILRKVLRIKYSNPSKNLNFLSSFLQSEIPKDAQVPT